MTRHDDFTRQLEAYLDEYEGTTPLPTHVRQAVRAKLPRTKQVGPPSGWPTRYMTMTMNIPGPARFAILAAVVAAVSVLGLNFMTRTNVGSGSIEGSYHTTFTKAELALANPREVGDTNWGEFTLRFANGRVSYTQRNAVASSSASGTFTVNGSTVTMAFDQGANVGETFAYRWSVTGNTLTLTRDSSLSLPAPTPLLVKPWTRN